MAKKDKEHVQLYQNMADFLKELMEDSKICKVFHDGRKDSLALHFFLDACPSNVFDLSAVYVMLEQMEQYMTQRCTAIAREQQSTVNTVVGKQKEETKLNMKE